MGKSKYSRIEHEGTVVEMRYVLNDQGVEVPYLLSPFFVNRASEFERVFAEQDRSEMESLVYSDSLSEDDFLTTINAR